MISTLRVTGIALLAASTFGLTPGAAHAQGTPEQREACTPDAVRICADTIPDVGRTTACMRAHRAELSARCQAVFEAVPAARPPHVARAKPGPRPAPRHETAAPMRPHRYAGVIAPRPHPGRHHPVAARGDRDTREARRVIGHLCGSRVIDADTCRFMGRVLTLAE